VSASRLGPCDRSTVPMSVWHLRRLRTAVLIRSTVVLWDLG
jgi:hypothetical protein